jgi:hypothetical protein
MGRVEPATFNPSSGLWGVQAGMTKPPKQLPNIAMTEEAIAILERRGFEVRGKTADEIREIIKHPPTKPSTVRATRKRLRDSAGGRVGENHCYRI